LINKESEETMNPELQPRPKKWPLSRNKTLLLAGAVVVAIIVIVAIVVGLQNRSDTDKTSNQSLYYDRPGYDRDKLGSGTADPMAVNFADSGDAVMSGSNKVVQACNVLGIDDITKQDLLLKANTIPTPITRTFNDSVGKGGYNPEISSSSLTSSSSDLDVNNCRYVLEGDSASISISVFQPFAVPNEPIDQELQRNYTASSSVEGLEVFTNKEPADENASEYILVQRGKGAFSLSISLESSQTDKKTALLTAAAKNFIQQQNDTSGLGMPKYDSPTFKKSFTRACDLTTNDDVRTLSGRDAGALAHEGIATSTAVLEFPNAKDTLYANIRNECTRGTVGGGSGLGDDGPGDFMLDTETTTFLESKPAKNWVEQQKQPNPNNRENMELPEIVGDGGVAYMDISGGLHLVFSKGRTVVDVSFSQKSAQRIGVSDLSSAANKLTPIAKSMADRVKN
jgi:hypothetical protein